MARADLHWTFPLTAAAKNYTNSVNIGGLALVTLRIPAMAATTTHLHLQTSEDPMTVLDADATWDPVLRDVDAAIIELPVSTSAVMVVKLNPTLFTGIRRVRLVAVNTSDAAVNQNGQIVTPTFVEL